MPRGGRRPRAGAPRGNTNALATGAHSRRYGEAIRLIAAIPGLHKYINKLYNTPGPDALRRRRDLLEAARHVISIRRNLAHQLELIIVTNLVERLDEDIPLAHRAIRDIADAPDYTQPLKRALHWTTWFAWHDEALERLLAEHILKDLEPALENFARKSIKQSNNQTPRPTKNPLSSQGEGAGGEVHPAEASPQ